MTTVAAYWNTTNGDWFDAADWNETDQNGNPAHYVPNANNDVSISGSTAFTITYDSSDTIDSIGGASLVTLALNGGSLTIANGNASATSSVNAIDLAAGATLSVGAGTLLLGNGSLTGTLSGAGDLDFFGGSFSLNAGVVLDVATLDLGVTGNGTVSTTDLNTNLSYAGTFRLDENGGDNAVLNLESHTLTLSGTDDFEGTFNGPGTVVVTDAAGEGSGGFTRPQVIGGGSLEDAAGATITQNAGGLGLGNSGSTGTLQVEAGSTYDIVATSSLGSTSPTNAVVDNAGTIDVGGSSTATLSAAFANTGALIIESGSAALLSTAVSDTLGGSISGAGTLQIGTGTATIATAAVTVAALGINGGNGGATTSLANDLRYAGTFTANGAFDTFDLASHMLTLSGTSTLASTFDGPGTLKVTGTATVDGSDAFEAGVVLEDAAAITQTGDLRLVATSTATASLQIDTGATYTIATASDITGDFSNAGMIGNSGTLIDSAAGTSEIDAALANAGTIESAEGATLRIAAPVTGTGNLQIDADAVLDLTGATAAGQTVTFEGSGATLGLGAPGSFAGAITGFAAGDTIDLAGETVTALTYDGTTATATLSDGSTQTFAISGSFASLTARSDGSGGTDILASAASSLQLTINPSVTFGTPEIATLRGSVTGGTGAVAVEIFEGTQDLGAATVKPNGTFVFTHNFGSGFQTGLTAIATDADGNQTGAPATFNLTTGIPGTGEKSSIDNYSVDGVYLGTTEYNARGAVFLQFTYAVLANGDQTNTYTAGTDLATLGLSSYVDTFDADGNFLSERQTVLVGGTHMLTGVGADDTFVFQRGFGQDTITDFNPIGSDHDVLSLPESEFSSLAQVIEHARQIGDTTVLTARDGDKISLDNVAIHQLRVHDFKFHA